MTTTAMAEIQAFKPTKPGTAEIKELPAGRLLENTGKGSYFDSSNRLFGPLFRYIQKKDIAMTTPVEARINPGAMYFWVSADQEEKATGDWNDVRVVDVAERMVASRGARGSYSQTNFEKVKSDLVDWLKTQPQIETVGEPFAVYWSGPMTPWFMKTFEVQVEVRPKQ